MGQVLTAAEYACLSSMSLFQIMLSCTCTSTFSVCLQFYFSYSVQPNSHCCYIFRNRSFSLKNSWCVNKNWFGQLVYSSFNVREPLWVLHKCVSKVFQVSCVILIAYNDVDMSFMSSEGFLPSVCSTVYYKSFWMLVKIWWMNSLLDFCHLKSEKTLKFCLSHHLWNC